MYISKFRTMYVNEKELLYQNSSKKIFTNHFKFQSITSSFSPWYFSITSWFTYWINLGDISLKGIWQSSNENSHRWSFWQRGTLTIHIYIIFTVPFHQCEYVCLLLWKRWKAQFKTKYWFSLSQKNFHFTLIYFYMVILLQKRVRELKTALPLMSYMAFELLGSNS